MQGCSGDGHISAGWLGHFLFLASCFGELSAGRSLVLGMVLHEPPLLQLQVKCLSLSFLDIEEAGATLETDVFGAKGKLLLNAYLILPTPLENGV